MNCSIELTNKQGRQKRFNLRVLTQAKENYQWNKSVSSEFRITTFRSPIMRKQQSNTIISKKTLTSYKSINRKNGGWLSTSYNSSSNNRLEVVREQIYNNLKKKQDKRHVNVRSIVQEVFEIGESINNNFYNYLHIESKIKLLNDKVRQLKSISCQFYCYCISGLILFEYCSLSLTIFYFDKALKALNSKTLYEFDCRLELLIYKYSSKVFLQIRKLKEAKDMAYMYLRKTWRYHNIDQQMCAYDLLGQIQLQQGNIEMSRYFHWRMCHAVREQKQILQISNQQLDKRSKQQIQLTVYEDIMTFVKLQDEIVSILSNHFRSQAEQQAKGFIKGKRNKQVLMYTHRSPNRILRNHRILQRKLIDYKQSNELHFIRPKDLKKLRKIITEFNSFVFDLKREEQLQMLKQEMETNDKEHFDTY